MSSTMVAPRGRRAEAVLREGTVQARIGVPVEPGGEPSNRTIAYSDAGPSDAPAVAVLGGISAGRHVTDAGGRNGWWRVMAGPGAPLDPLALRVISIDWPGGPGDSVLREGRTRLAYAEVITPRDQADALAAVVAALGLGRLHGVIGASYGGAVATAFAARHSQLVRGALVIGAAHRSHPLASAVRWIQRRIVSEALESNRPGEGVALARALAITTYGSDRGWANRFDRRPSGNATEPWAALEANLLAQGGEFAERWTAAQFIRMTRSLDLHDVDPAEIRVPLTLVSIDPDFLAPRWLVEELAATTAGPCRVVRIDSVHGHDAFLEDAGALAPVLTEFLNNPELRQ